MRARRLSQDQTTKRQNIIWFGSYGSKMGSVANVALRMDKEYSESPLICSESLLCNENTFLGGTSYYDYIRANMYVGPDPLAKIKATITGYSGIFKVLFKCKITNNGSIREYQKSFDGINGSSEVSIASEIWSELSEEDEVFDVIIGLFLSVSIPAGATFSLSYPVKEAKLTYDRSEFYNGRSPSYADSQSFNYSSRQESVKDALIPRLSVIQGELWYNPSYGLPLMSKLKSKGIYDSIIVGYIVNYPDVASLSEFYSSVEGHTYNYDCIINTVFGEEIRVASE